MISEIQIERYLFQQSEIGQEVIQMKQYMKAEYCKAFSIPFSEIKTGKLNPLVNGNTGKIERFIEE